MKNYAKTLSIGIVLVLALGFYLQKQSPLVKNEVERPQVEIVQTSMSAELDTDLPPIVASSSTGPEDCFERGVFVDFISATSQLFVSSGTVEWSSNPPLPGFATSTGTKVLRTYYIDPNESPGCYTIKAEQVVNGQPICESVVTIRIKEFASDPCTECAAGPGGPGL